LHVLITKPATQLLSHHIELIEAARKHNVLCFVEHHKRSDVVPNVNVALNFVFTNATVRFDPVYSDAKAKAATLGEFNFFNAWMSQPKSQLNTFRAWAGKDSDIRYHY
jgi:D-galacturonate reductase